MFYRYVLVSLLPLGILVLSNIYAHEYVIVEHNNKYAYNGSNFNTNMIF